jgi:DNA-directed RNA polymerase specialized sigma24 family protein
LLKTAQEQVVAARRKHLLAERRTVRREVGLPERSSLLLAQPLLAAASSPGSRVEREETHRKILEAVAALESIDREMLLLRHVEARPYDEISHLLAIDAAAARKRYGRALLRLRAELARRNLLDSV